MKFLFLLSGENLDLAMEEVISLAQPSYFRQSGKVIFIEGNQFDFSRLAYSHAAYSYIFSCPKSKLVDCIKKTNWNNFYRKNFCVRTTDSGEWKEKDLAGLIWPHLNKPQVNLISPSTRFDFIFTKEEVFCGLLITETGKGFIERSARSRPCFHPSSMNAKLARAIVNLTAVKPNEILLDPFCGCGGILIEAGMIKARVVGIDIDPIMVDNTKENMKHFGIKNYKLKAGDSTVIKLPKVDAIATDPPYGRSSSLHKKAIKKLYSLFLENAYNNLLKKGKRMCMVVPSNIKVKSKFKKISCIDFYVHKSLTRRIFVLEK